MSNQETVDADALRETLEARVSKLQKTLQYWQTWEAEYEGLKDELDALEEDPTTEQMYQIGCDYASHVVNEKEVAQLVALGKTPARSRMQVVALLKGRMQTGKRNAETVQKQIDKAEDQIDLLDSGTDPADIKRDLMEITEEIDDSGNVLSSKLENFDQAAEEIAEVIKNHSLRESRPAQKQPTKDSSATSSSSSSTPSNSASASKPVIVSESSKPAQTTSLPSQPPQTTSPKPSPTSKIIELDHDETLEDYDHVTIDTSTPAGEAAARREFHRNLHDIGPVVATLDLQELDQDWSEDDWDDDQLEDDFDDFEENNYGMNNIQDQMSQEYVKEMEALIQKHSIKNLGSDLDPQNVGLSSTSRSSSTVAPINKTAPPKSALANKNKKAKSALAPPVQNQHPNNGNKGVRFAGNLDIAQPPSITPENPPPQSESVGPAPLAEAIVERSSIAKTISNPTNAPKMSRFKANKLGNTVKDRSAVTKSQGLARSDQDLQRQSTREDSLKAELAMYKDRMMAPEHQPEPHIWNDQPGELASDHPTQKISMFKAARLGLSMEDLELEQQ